MITIVNALVASAGKVLLMHKHGLWMFPGGCVESGESYEQAVQREWQEAFPHATLQLEETLRTVQGRTPGTGRLAEVHVYVAAVEGDCTPSAVITAAGWYPPWEAFILPLSPLTYAILSQYHQLVSDTFPRHDS